jgi:hypothetical protein
MAISLICGRIQYQFHFLGKRRYTLDQIEREEFTEETESERPESEPEVSLTQRLPTKPFSSQCWARNILTVLRETLTQYITSNRRGRGDSILLYLFVLQPVVLHRPVCEDSDKIPEGRTSTYILHLSGLTKRESRMSVGMVVFGFPTLMGDGFMLFHRRGNHLQCHTYTVP